MRPESLAPTFRNDPTIEPPYSSSQICETAFHREILNIYRSARAETKWVYDMGRDTDRVEEENWVIRWMLWHVFRYRDNRNRNRRTPLPTEGKAAHELDDSPDESSNLGRAVTITIANPATRTTISGQTRYYDPVRDT